MRPVVARLSALLARGGPGSGHFGHEGRPGERGGSLPGEGGQGSFPPSWPEHYDPRATNELNLGVAGGDDDVAEVFQAVYDRTGYQAHNIWLGTDKNAAIDQTGVAGSQYQKEALASQMNSVMAHIIHRDIVAGSMGRSVIWLNAERLSKYGLEPGDDAFRFMVAHEVGHQMQPILDMRDDPMDNLDGFQTYKETVGYGEQSDDEYRSDLIAAYATGSPEGGYFRMMRSQRDEGYVLDGPMIQMKALTQDEVYDMNTIIDRVRQGRPPATKRSALPFEVFRDPGPMGEVLIYLGPELEERGGPGSGNFGHEGRPGEVGGSAPGDGAVELVGTPDLPYGADAPNTAWYAQDLQDASRRVSEQTIRRDYARQGTEPAIYEAWIPMEDMPSPVLVEEEDNDPEAYDWSEYGRGNTFPPAKVEVTDDGIKILDGNHRIRFWDQADFQYAPAWVVDYRYTQEEADNAELEEESLAARGGPGSGHHGHEGRPGEVGGSLPGDGAVGSVTWPLADGDRRTLAAGGVMLHGGSTGRTDLTGVPTFEGVSHYFVSDPGEGSRFGSKTQAEHIAGGPFGGYLTLVREREGAVVPFEPNRNPAHAAALEKILPGQNPLYPIPYNRMTTMSRELQRMTGANRFRVEEPSVQSESRMYLDPVKTLEIVNILPAREDLRTRGGPGSGHFGHEGRPGEVGGSAPGDEPGRGEEGQRRDARGDRTGKALATLERGTIEPHPGRQGRGKLAPVAGRVYATADPEYALMYALGGDVAGHGWVPPSSLEKGQDGYIFEVDAGALGDIQPDEDSIGSAIAEGKYDWLTQLAEENLSGPMFDKVIDGEYGDWAAAGKRLVGLLSDEQKFQMIRDGASIANLGALPIVAAWRVDKGESAQYPERYAFGQGDDAERQRKLFAMAESVPLTTRGGAGSGHWGHAGRPGEVGGSSPGDEPGRGEEGQRRDARGLARLRRGEARAAEPSVTALMQRVAGQTGGGMHKLESRLKGETSLTRKISDEARDKGLTLEEAEKDVVDALRYTMLFETDGFVDNVLAAEEAMRAEGWGEYDTRFRNYFAPGDSYDGYNTAWVNKAGTVFELQFHTPQTATVKEDAHDYYDNWRHSTDQAERSELWGKMSRLWDDIERPDGWERLPGQIVMQ